MLQSHIFITQGYLDTAKVNFLVAWAFFQNKSFANFSDFPSESDLEKNYNKHLVSGQILEKSYQKKEDFTKDISNLYQKYPQPTLLFLGDLSSYSEKLQEGMLKLLEEPSQNLFIILYSKDAVNILPTIKSRSVVHTFSKQIILNNLDQKLLKKVQEKLPSPAEFIKDLLQKKVQSLPDLSKKKVEREELDFWLWQLSLYADEIFKNNPNLQVSKLQEKILKAKSLNMSYVQKKFSLGEFLF